MLVKRPVWLVEGTPKDKYYLYGKIALRFDLTDVTTAAGRDVVRNLLSGRIRVHGMVRHLGTVRRLSMLLSAR